MATDTSGLAAGKCVDAGGRWTLTTGDCGPSALCSSKYTVSSNPSLYKSAM